MIPRSCNGAPTYDERIAQYQRRCNELPKIKPIRILQLLMASCLLALTIYTIIEDSPYTESVKILLILVFGSYFFIALVDIISQLGGDPIPETPMFLFGIVALVLFLLTAFQIFTISKKYEVKEAWRVTMTIILAVFAALLYLTDILLIFLYGY